VLVLISSLGALIIISGINYYYHPSYEWGYTQKPNSLEFEYTYHQVVPKEFFWVGELIGAIIFSVGFGPLVWYVYATVKKKKKASLVQSETFENVLPDRFCPICKTQTYTAHKRGFKCSVCNRDNFCATHGIRPPLQDWAPGFVCDECQKEHLKAQPQPLHCANCGKQLPEGKNDFCTYCGKKL